MPQVRQGRSRRNSITTERRASVVVGDSELDGADAVVRLSSLALQDSESLYEPRCVPPLPLTPVPSARPGVHRSITCTLPCTHAPPSYCRRTGKRNPKRMDGSFGATQVCVAAAVQRVALPLQGHSQRARRAARGTSASGALLLLNPWPFAQAAPPRTAGVLGHRELTVRVADVACLRSWDSVAGVQYTPPGFAPLAGVR